MLNYKHKGSGWLCPAWLWATRTTVTHHLFTGGFQLKHLKPRQRWGRCIFHAAEVLNLKPGGGGVHWFHAALPSNIQKTPSMPVPCGKLPFDFYFFLFTNQETAFFLRDKHVRYTSQSELWGFFFLQEISVLNIALHTSPLSRPFNFWPEASSQ